MRTVAIIYHHDCTLPEATCTPHACVFENFESDFTLSLPRNYFLKAKIKNKSVASICNYSLKCGRNLRQITLRIVSYHFTS